MKDLDIWSATAASVTCNVITMDGDKSSLHDGLQVVISASEGRGISILCSV